MKRYPTILLLCLLSAMAGWSYGNPPADSLFAIYFARARAYADAYPREKAYLHLDNTSYYDGDTIWYKAYVVRADNNLPSTISTPLYVELVSQWGSIVERQIVRLEDGEGAGQFVLNKTMFSGYYEIRAYTKWMLAFGEKQYFSRVIPVYRKRRSDVDEERSIITYKMDNSMKQRPKPDDRFQLRFFPEGGQLVQGVPSVVAFEAVSPDEGAVAVTGTVQDEDGHRIAQFVTLHDGMGSFVYTPTGQKDRAVVSYQGKEYSFPLPQALPKGYVLTVVPGEQALSIKVRRSDTSLQDTLALFVFNQGRPLAYQTVDFKDDGECNFVLPTSEFPGGVTQLSLLTARGAVLCERFCYLMPRGGIRLEASSPNALYYPFEPVEYRVSMKDADGRPLQGHFSVTIRDGFQSDYRKYDQNIYTDLLLTSDLKGYIHEPGYYFVDNSPRRRAALDMLLMIRGWRKYDMQAIVGAAPATPVYQPEKRLTIHGKITSFFRNKAKENMEVGIVAKRDTLSVAGFTYTDSLGYFQVPMDNFGGTLDAVVQTRRKGKKRKLETNILFFRNFEPESRMLSYEEWHPKWEDTDGLRWWANLSDSLYLDSLMSIDSKLLEQVTIKAKKSKYKKILAFEQSVIAYYDIPRELDRLRDEGKYIKYFTQLMEHLNPSIIGGQSETLATDDGVLLGGMSLYYAGRGLTCILNGVLYPFFEQDLFLNRNVDAIKSVMICEGRNADAGIISERQVAMTDENLRRQAEIARSPAFEEEVLKDYLNNKDIYDDNLNVVDATKQGRFKMYCYITTVDGWKPTKKYRAKGMRSTRIQGYSEPQEFYSPYYPDISKGQGADHRRTLYWNPCVETDANGEAVIHCNNANSSTFVTVSCEAVHDGQPVAVTVHSIGL